MQFLFLAQLQVFSQIKQKSADLSGFLAVIAGNCFL